MTALTVRRYRCCEERRLEAVKAAGVLNGIEYLEVSDRDAPTESLRQRTLFLRLLQAPPAFTPANVVIGGGERIRNVAVEWVAPANALPAGEDPSLVAGLTEPETVLVVRTLSRGDFSSYTLDLVAGAGSLAPPANFDPLLASVEFSFKVECDSDFDCAPSEICPPERREVPVIDYLAKDFDSFRGLMLDRLSLLTPGWIERNVADVGTTLVELLAYVADELSYRQDAIATEAYLATARRRVSLRRHARLVDYVVSEGCNARAWVRVAVTGEGVVLAAGTPVLTRTIDLPPVFEPNSPEHRAALEARAETFEVVDDAILYQSHDRFDFWTFGDAACCLPQGATGATLTGDHPALKAGDVLVLAEVVSPTTGQAADADPYKRVAVRLTRVVASADPSGGRFATPPTNASVAVTEIEWDASDALPFPLCISVADRPGLTVSEVWGNIVLADHGRTIADESLGSMPEPVLTYAPATDAPQCEQPAAAPVPARFRPALEYGPVTHVRAAPTTKAGEGSATAALVADLDAFTFSPALHDWLGARGFTFTAGPAIVRGGDGWWSVSDGTAVALLRIEGIELLVSARPAACSATIATEAGPSPADTRPAVDVRGTLHGATEPWTPQPDLLGSDGDAREFVVEGEHDASATLRFGDGVHGRRPEIGTSFTATYRVGNGVAGNVGIGAIAHVATLNGQIASVVNPLPAHGGIDPETDDAVRRNVPQAFLVQQRAVTADDYARMTERDPDIQRAAASFRWTGSWRTVFVTADRVGGGEVDTAFEQVVRAHLEPYRMAGYDLEINGPQFVALKIQLLVCVKADYFRAHVKAAVLDVLSNGVRADGTLGFFHPDRFTFGQPVYLSAILAAVQAVSGVESVQVENFERQHDDSSSGMDAGMLPMGRLEIAQLDNDPSFPEHGVLVIGTGGGK